MNLNLGLYVTQYLSVLKKILSFLPTVIDNVLLCNWFHSYTRGTVMMMGLMMMPL